MTQPDLAKAQSHVDRAAGAAPKGRLYVGVSVGTVGTAKASIPSRFETVLNMDAHERSGFGRRTFRFDEPMNDLPGPGAYTKSRAIINKTQVALSFSTKGSAAFASSSKLGGSLAPSSTFTPGPAAYNPTDAARRNGAYSAPTAAFANPQPRPLLKRHANSKGMPPGPGAYYPEKVVQPPPGGKFTTRAPRDVGPLEGSKKLPGPGEYLPDWYLNTFSAANPNRTQHPSKSPVSGQEIQRRATAVAALPPFFAQSCLPPSQSPLPEPVIEAAEERREREKRLKAAGALQPLEPKPSPPSAVFANTTLDRFGRPTVRYTSSDEGLIGPGSYDMEKKPRRMLISSSWALSTAERGSPRPRYAVPGPAYYNAEQAPPRKVSHHLLSHEYWS